MGAGAQELSLGWARLAVEGSGLPIRVEGSRATTHLELRAVVDEQDGGRRPDRDLS